MLRIELELKEKYMSEINKRFSTKDSYLLDSREQIKILQTQKNELEEKINRLTRVFKVMEKNTKKMACYNNSPLSLKSNITQKENIEEKNNLILENKSFEEYYDDFSLPNWFYEETSTVDNEKNTISTLTQSGKSHEQNRFAYVNDAKKMSNSSIFSVLKSECSNTKNNRLQSPEPKHHVSFIANPVYCHKNGDNVTSNQIKTSILCNRSINTPDFVSIKDGWIKNLNSISSRLHSFNNINYPSECCEYCKKSFNSSKAVSKCDDCGVICHSSCTIKVPTPCVPRNIFYKYGSKIKLSFPNICPQTFPMIPYIVVHCIIALEKYYPTIKNLYELPESKLEVSKLYNTFLYSHTIPILENFAAPTIVGCLLKFLRAFSDPIIPHFLWEKFEAAIHKINKDTLVSVIYDLPKPNLNTLAFLCLHWKRVAEKSYPNIKVGIYNISNAIAPTVVGFKTSPEIISLDQMEKEMESQKLLMLGLLQLSDAFWKQILSCPTDNITYRNQIV
uniref:Rac GTPase-activating protein 1 n=1 Tax=Strongyloides papillosus TaxID=174720 RepID=A0A0N5BNI5_STREA